MSDWTVTATYRGNLAPVTTRAISDALLDRDGLATNIPDGRFSVSVTSQFHGEKPSAMRSNSSPGC